MRARDTVVALLAVVAGHRPVGVVGRILDAGLDPGLVVLPVVGVYTSIDYPGAASTGGTAIVTSINPRGDIVGQRG